MSFRRTASTARKALRFGPTPVLLLAAVWLVTWAGAAHAGLLFTFTDTSCTGCGTGPFGTVLVSQDASGLKELDFTVTLNSPYEFHQTTTLTHPVFAVDLNVLHVTFSNFKLNNVVTTKVTSSGASGSVPITLEVKN